MEPEVVATSPNRIKSPVPVYCGFDSLKMVLAIRFTLTLATFSTSCLCIGLRELLAQCHKEWSLQPVMLRQDFFTIEIRRLLRGGEWSQSRVLPSAELAYDACLSAGSIAMLAHGHRCEWRSKVEPSLGIAPSSLAYRASASLEML